MYDRSFEFRNGTHASQEQNRHYKYTGMTALDLLRMLQKYESVRQAVESSLSLEFR
jgi:hypothetical protein